MELKQSLKFKMLRLVMVQAGLLAFVLAVLWAINPRWVLWHQQDNPEISEAMSQFKHHYGMLNALNMQLAQKRSDKQPQAIDLEKIGIELHQHIQGIKSVGLTAQAYYKLDFTVLINFLFNYKSQIAQLSPSAPSYDAQLWDTLLYFSRIQSEFFYIIEEIERFDREKSAHELQNAQSSLLIWGLSNLLVIAVGLAIALNYARRWQAQVANLLAQIYRISADDYTTTSEIKTDDELGFLAKAVQEAVQRIRHQKGTEPK